MTARGRYFSNVGGVVLGLSISILLIKYAIGW